MQYFMGMVYAKEDVSLQSVAHIQIRNLDFITKVWQKLQLKYEV